MHEISKLEDTYDGHGDDDDDDDACSGVALMHPSC